MLFWSKIYITGTKLPLCSTKLITFFGLVWKTLFYPKKMQFYMGNLNIQKAKSHWDSYLYFSLYASAKSRKIDFPYRKKIFGLVWKTLFGHKKM